MSAAIFAESVLLYSLLDMVVETFWPSSAPAFVTAITLAATDDSFLIQLISKFITKYSNEIGVGFGAGLGTEFDAEYRLFLNWRSANDK